jgi:hypothetical protein
MSELPVWKNSRRVAPWYGAFSCVGRFFDMIYKVYRNLADEFVDERTIAFAGVAVATSPGAAPRDASNSRDPSNLRGVGR